MSFLINRTFLTVFLSLMMPVLYALNSDNALPVSVTSDTLTVNLKQGLAEYKGNVVATQGHRVLTGDQLLIQRAPDGKIQSFTAIGRPAKTQDLPSPDSAMAYGQAETIYYYPEEQLVKYVKHAHFTQGGNVFEGEVITYNLATMVVSSPQTQNHKGITTLILPAYNATHSGKESQS